MEDLLTLVEDNRQIIKHIKCLKNKKINFSPAILKLETLLYKNIYILIHLISEERAL